MQVIKYFDKLYKDKNQLNLLNWTYWVLISIGIICSAVVAIFSQPLGAALLIIPILCLIAICLNMFTWRIVENMAQKRGKSKLYQILCKTDKIINKQNKKATKKTHAKRHTQSSR